jgi:hypothetical protein
MAENISLTLKTDIAKQYKDSFIKMNPKNVAYVFLAKTLPYDDENTPDELNDSLAVEKQIWDNMYAAKKIVPGNIEFVLPRNTWANSTTYTQFDDTVNLADLSNMYTITSEGNVYKCLCSNKNNPSTVEPTGDYTSSNGVISTADGYMWKYMYNVKASNKFLTENWMPVPYSASEVVPLDYNLNSSNYVDGGLNKIIVTDGGSGYVHTSGIPVNPFVAGSNFITITAGSTTEGVANNMFISGVGIAARTYITDVSTELNRITLSNPTTGSGGGSNTVSVTTRVEIVGDGVKDSTATTVQLENDTLYKISVTTTGIGFSKANVIIHGTGTGATARAVLPPKYGHGFYPAIELGARHLMVVTRIGEVDSTEGDKISSNVSFRQYGIVSNPHSYGNTSPILYDQANTVISQTLDISLLSSGSYQQNEKVYQFIDGEETFYGYVNSQNTNIVKLTNTYGTLSIGSLLIGANSSVSRPVQSYQNPEFDPYSGQILYSKNIISVERSEGQAEEIKLVIHF